MTVELITILLSLLILISVYFSRIKSRNGETILFSENFLHKADENIFEFVKFVFKLYSLLFHNISTFLSKIPHKVAHNVHAVSHKVAQKSSNWIDKITHNKK
ncbi:MAG: hypothetical protein RLY49_615 [Candidatus Parcubacteria bacterium]|jgi:hypothetical protein